MVLWLGEGDAYALLGELLRAEYGLGVLPAMARGADGKPYFPGEPELHFNVSHSGGLALCGAGEAPLGVDVEVLRPRRPGLARYVCSEAESAWLERQGRGLGGVLHPLDVEGGQGQMHRGGSAAAPPGHRRSSPPAGGDGRAGWAGLFRLFRRNLAGGGLLPNPSGPVGALC